MKAINAEKIELTSNEIKILEEWYKGNQPVAINEELTPFINGLTERLIESYDNQGMSQIMEPVPHHELATNAVNLWLYNRKKIA